MDSKVENGREGRWWLLDWSRKLSDSLLWRFILGIIVFFIFFNLYFFGER